MTELRAWAEALFTKRRVEPNSGLGGALRYMLTYGPRQSVFNPYTGICSIFSTRLLNGLPPVLYEDGRQTRDFVFVEDVAQANLAVMERAGVPITDKQRNFFL